MFLIAILLIAFVILIVVTSGASFAMRYYRGRFEQNEKTAAIIIGATFSLLFPTMYGAENAFPGRTGELVATGLMAAICIAGGVVAWRILARRTGST